MIPMRTPCSVLMIGMILMMQMRTPLLCPEVIWEQCSLRYHLGKHNPRVGMHHLQRRSLTISSQLLNPRMRIGLSLGQGSMTMKHFIMIMRHMKVMNLKVMKRRRLNRIMRNSMRLWMNTNVSSVEIHLSKHHQISLSNSRTLWIQIPWRHL